MPKPCDRGEAIARATMPSHRWPKLMLLSDIPEARVASIRGNDADSELGDRGAGHLPADLLYLDRWQPGIVPKAPMSRYYDGFRYARSCPTRS